MRPLTQEEKDIIEKLKRGANGDRKARRNEIRRQIRQARRYDHGLQRELAALEPITGKPIYVGTAQGGFILTDYNTVHKILQTTKGFMHRRIFMEAQGLVIEYQGRDAKGTIEIYDREDWADLKPFRQRLPVIELL